MIVYPGHGAGSLCGKNMRAERSSTIRTERLTNYAVKIDSREEFVRQLTTNLPPRPEYFPQDAAINRVGAPALSELPKLEPISAEMLQSLLKEGVFALDVRPGDDFAARACTRLSEYSALGRFCLLGGQPAWIIFAAGADPGIGGAVVRGAKPGWPESALTMREILEDEIKGWTQAGLALAELEQINPQTLE